MRKRPSQVKAKRAPTSRRETKESISPIRRAFMEQLKTWCNAPEGRDARTARKQEIAKLLKKNVQTIKNMYLYGQGPMDDWFTIMDHIGPLKQETIIQLYASYPYLTQELNKLNAEQLRMHRYVARMTERELMLINKLVEVGLEANQAAEGSKE